MSRLPFLLPLFALAAFQALAQERLEVSPYVETATKPWTSLDLNNDPGSFQFAIVSDNAGGPRQGIFAEAMLKLNLLQPEFVMGVGDMIEGYEDLRGDLELQWDRFLEDVAPLEMPFFFVPGNHDVGRPLWAEVYKARFGADYYHFLYKDVLFLILNTNDNPEKGTGIGEVQVAYAKKVLADFPDVRWTLVFQHKPLWNDKGAMGWPEIEAALAGRKATAFAGHTHRYLSQERDGISYLTLGTTGGGNPLRGVAYGEFDHVVWVTFKEEEGPRVANLLLDGILDKDLRTEASTKAFGLFSADQAVRATPILQEEPTFTEGVSQITVKNPSTRPLRFKALFEVAEGVAVSPGSLAFEVAPESEKQVDLKVQAAGPTAIEKTQPVVMHWQGFYDNLENNPSQEVGGEFRIPIEAPFKLPVLEKSPNVDGDLGEWEELPFVVDQPGEIYFNTPAWKGPGDGSFRFAVGRDEENLYVAISASDDQRCFEGWKYWEDFAMISVDARASATEEIKGKVFNLSHGPRLSEEQAAEYEESEKPEGFARASRETENGFTTEFSIPLDYLKQAQGGDWSRVRLNVSISDFDTGDQREGVTILNWRPRWDGSRRYAESGVFVK
jgi:hypothetical protein